MVFRSLPTVSELLESPQIKKLLDSASHNTVVTGVQTFLDQMRTEIQAAADNAPSVTDLADRIAKWMSRGASSGIHSVINATGMLLSDELGGAPLAADALEHAVTTTGGYCDVSRGGAASVESQLQQLTGAEAALVVAQPAGAALLAATLAAGKQALISRSEVTSFGNSRVVRISEQSGATLREVGSIHECLLSDYRESITSEAGIVLRVESNRFQTLGDSRSVSRSELAGLAHRRHLPFIVCNEVGTLVDLQKYGLPGSTVQQILSDGADLVVLSGHQMLGGPPCGIIVGRRELVKRVRQHPLADMIAASKLTLAALDGTLALYQSPDTLEEKLPILRLLSTTAANLRHRAERLAPQLQSLDSVREAAPLDDVACLTSAVPQQQVNTCCVAIYPAVLSAEEFADRLRRQAPSVWPRVHNGQVLLDLRTVMPGDDELLVEAIRNVGN